MGRLWSFLWSKNRSNSVRAACLKAFRGLCPAAAAEVLSLFISGLNDAAGSQDTTWSVQVWALVYMLIYMADDRANFMYWTVVPGSGIRQELRQRLQHVFLSVEEAEQPTWPIGRCATILNVDVPNTVKCWTALFELIQLCASSLALLAVTIKQTCNDPQTMVICLSTFAILYASTVVNIVMRRPNLLDLAIRKRDWRHTATSIACLQIEKIPTTGQRCDPNLGPKIYGEAAEVYRRRGNHFKFTQVISALTASEMSLVAKFALMMIVGRQAILGNAQVAQVVALISILESLRKSLRVAADLQLTVIEGYASLLSILSAFKHQLEANIELCSSGESSSDRS